MTGLYAIPLCIWFAAAVCHFLAALQTQPEASDAVTVEIRLDAYDRGTTDDITEEQALAWADQLHAMRGAEQTRELPAVTDEIPEISRQGRAILRAARERVVVTQSPLARPIGARGHQPAPPRQLRPVEPKVSAR